MSGPFSVQLADGRTFVATEEPTTGPLPPMAECCKDYSPSEPCKCAGDHTANDQSKLRYLSELWLRAREGKRTEHLKLTMIEKFYRGIHFTEIGSYKNLEVTNFCYSNVETVAGIFNRSRAMPRIEPSGPMDANRAQIIREVANWWQNQQRVWMQRSLGNRIKTKNGYTIILLTIDQETGIPSASNWSVWDWYPDPSGRDIPGCEYFVFAAPIPTRRLRAMFPDKAHLIKPDNYCSPYWDVEKLIDRHMFHDQYQRTYTMPVITNDASTAQYKGATQPTGATSLSPETGAYEQRGAETTFFFQFVCRDRTPQTWSAPGKVIAPSPIPGDPDAIETPDVYTYQRPASPSGWRSYFAVPGALLRETPIDECYGGLPFVVDYYVRHESRISGIGEIEPIAPIQRSYNERKNMLQTSLRLQARPVLRADFGHGITNLSKRAVDAGDILEPKRGSNIEWLEYGGPNAQQFEHLQTEKRDMEIVSGVHEALQGIRPEGVETGVAIRELASASATRIQAKMPEGMIAWAEVLWKALRIMRAKLKVPIVFRASDGRFLTIGRNELAGEYTFKFAADENDLEAEEKIKNDTLTYYQLGLIDRGEALKRIGYPDYIEVTKRMALMDLAKAQIEAQARAQSGGPGGNGKPASKGGDRASVAS